MWSQLVHHILRCGYSTDVPSSCNHTTDIVLSCTRMPLWNYPYETNTVWLDQVSCIHSCDCLSGCFSDFPNTSIFRSDDSGCIQVQCCYDVQIQDKFSPDICSNNQTHTCGDNTTGSSSIVTIIAIVCGVLVFSFIHKSEEKGIYFNPKLISPIRFIELIQ